MELRVAALACLALAGGGNLFGWGREGHRLIAEIAERRLNAKARAEVAALLDSGETLQSIASWADDVRLDRKETSTWHYINIPVTASAPEWRKYCPATGCVVEVIPRMIEKLKERSLPKAERAEALKFLVHFAGDLHQPLHCGDKGDRGGNDVQVIFRDRPANLHSVWDTPLLQRMLEKDPALGQRLAKGPGAWAARGMRKGGPQDWVWDSHAASRDVAYANLPAARPAVLDANYELKAAPVIQQQLLRGGVRLAALLNDALGK